MKGYLMALYHIGALCKSQIKVYFVIRQKLFISEVIKKDRQYNSNMRKNTKKQTIVCKTLGLFRKVTIEQYEALTIRR